MKISSVIKSFRIYGFRRTCKRLYNRLSFFMVRKVLRRRIAAKKIHGSRMWLDLETKGISQALWQEDTREELDIALVKKELKPGENVLEIGANIGYYLLLEGRMIGTEGKIYAFEPDPRNIPLLKKNIQENELEDRVLLFPYAVGDENSTHTLHLANFSNLSSMIGAKDSVESVEVTTVKVDEFSQIDREINFIRMDIEGYEYEAIKGMLNTLKKSLGCKILLELHPSAYTPQRDFSEVVSQLFALGFKVRYVISAGTHLPPSIIAKGYKPISVAQEMVHSHGLYENIKEEDFMKFIKSPTKVVRSVMFSK